MKRQKMTEMVLLCIFCEQFSFPKVTTLKTSYDRGSDDSMKKNLLLFVTIHERKYASSNWLFLSQQYHLVQDSDNVLVRQLWLVVVRQYLVDLVVTDGPGLYQHGCKYDLRSDGQIKTDADLIKHQAIPCHLSGNTFTKNLFLAK